MIAILVHRHTFVVRPASLIMAPCDRSTGVVQLDAATRSAEPVFFINIPDGTTELRVGFYNVGIQEPEVGGARWPEKREALKSDIVRAFTRHGLTMLCLSELSGIH